MRLRALVMVLVVLVIVAGVVWYLWGGLALRELGRREEVQHLMQQMQNLPQPLGNPQAKVVVEIIAPPFACHAPQFMELGKEIHQEFGDKVYIKYTVSPPPGVATCLGIAINGKQEFTIEGRKVILHGPMASPPPVAKGAPAPPKVAGPYTLEDIKEAVKQEIEKAYPKAGK